MSGKSGMEENCWEGKNPQWVVMPEKKKNALTNLSPLIFSLTLSGWLISIYLSCLWIYQFWFTPFFTPTFFRNTTTTYNTALVVTSINTAVQHYYNHTDIYNLHKAHTARLNWWYGYPTKITHIYTQKTVCSMNISTCPVKSPFISWRYSRICLQFQNRYKIQTYTSECTVQQLVNIHFISASRHFCAPDDIQIKTESINAPYTSAGASSLGPLEWQWWFFLLYFLKLGWGNIPYTNGNTLQCAISSASIQNPHPKFVYSSLYK